MALSVFSLGALDRYDHPVRLLVDLMYPRTTSSWVGLGSLVTCCPTRLPPSRMLCLLAGTPDAFRPWYPDVPVPRPPLGPRYFLYPWCL